MRRRCSDLGVALALALAFAVALVPACYDVPEPTCGFVCGPVGECPANYTCVDARCHRNGDSVQCGSSPDAPTAPDAAESFDAESFDADLIDAP